MKSKTTTLHRLSYLIGMLFFGFLTYSTMNGELQKIIHFAGVANELGFIFFTSILTFVLGYSTISE